MARHQLCICSTVFDVCFDRAFSFHLSDIWNDHSQLNCSQNPIRLFHDKAIEIKMLVSEVLHILNSHVVVV